MKKTNELILNLINAITLTVALSALAFKYVQGYDITQSGYQTFANQTHNALYPLYICIILLASSVFFALVGILETNLEIKRKKTHNALVLLCLLCTLYMIFGIHETRLLNERLAGNLYKTQAFIPFILACSEYLLTFALRYKFVHE